MPESQSHDHGNTVTARSLRTGHKYYLLGAIATSTIAEQVIGKRGLPVQ